MFANMEGKDSTSGQRNRVCGMLHEEGDPPGSIFRAVSGAFMVGWELTYENDEKIGVTNIKNQEGRRRGWQELDNKEMQQGILYSDQ